MTDFGSEVNIVIFRFSTIKLCDTLDPAAFDYVLRTMYTGKLELNDDNVINVLQLANKIKVL